jgi:hypothetical protein
MNKEDLKTVGQIRKAMLPLVEILRAETNKDLTARLEKIETVLADLVKKDYNVTVQPTPVTVEGFDPTQLIEKMQKMNQKKLEPAVVQPVLKYEPHDQSGGVIKYNGFVAEDGSWYIQRLSKSSQRYAKGKGDYIEAWDKKTKLEYGLIDGGR